MSTRRGRQHTKQRRPKFEEPTGYRIPHMDRALWAIARPREAGILHDGERRVLAAIWLGASKDTWNDDLLNDMTVDQLIEHASHLVDAGLLGPDGIIRP